MNHLAIIGGSGLYDIENLEVTSEHEIETPFGWPSDQIKEIVTPSGKKAFFLARHGQNHQFAPSEINYRANIYALKKLGCRYICSFSAAGSLREEIKQVTLPLLSNTLIGPKPSVLEVFSPMESRATSLWPPPPMTHKIPS